MPGAANTPRKATAATRRTTRRRKRARENKAEPPCRAAIQNGARSPEHRQLGHLEPEIPGFAPPPRDELAFLDTLGIGTHAPGLEGAARGVEISHRFWAPGNAGVGALSRRRALPQTTDLTGQRESRRLRSDS